MKARRFFVEGKPLRPGERLVEGKRAHHLTRVLRLGAGERVLLFDGSGFEFPAEILEVGRQLIRLKVAEGTRVDRESPLKLGLALGVCQPAVMDLIIQKATELGVAEIIPVKTERAQGWLAGERTASRFGRWERIAQEAARQCGRSKVPNVTPLAKLTQVLKEKEATGLKLIFWEEEERSGLRQTIVEEDGASEVYVLVGPEGGFTADEVEQAVAAGFRSISLGRRILRTETAAIIAIGLLQYELGDLGLLP